jgi:hypothetical protein
VRRSTKKLFFSLYLGEFGNFTAHAAGVRTTSGIGHLVGNYLVAQRNGLSLSGVGGGEPGNETCHGEGEDGSANKEFHIGNPLDFLKRFVWMFPTDVNILAGMD